MLNLTTNIPVPNLNKVRLRHPRIDDDAGVFSVLAEVTMVGGLVYGTYQLEFRNGPCQGLRAKAVPSSGSDYVETFTSSAPILDGFDSAVAAFVGATMNARLDGLETWAVGQGLLPPGTVS